MQIKHFPAIVDIKTFDINYSCMAKLSKRHQRSGTVQEEGLTNEGRHHLLFVDKQAHSIQSLHVYILKTNCVCGGRIFERNITTLKSAPSPHL